MIQAKIFFPLSIYLFPDLFSADDEPVWNVLKKIKPFLKTYLQPNLSNLPIGLLSKTYVLCQGKLLENGFVIDRSTGKSQVIIDQQVYPEASILYAGSIFFDSTISIGQGSIVEPGALIMGPTIIGDYTEIRQGAYVRGEVIVGHHCVVGHTTEVKHSVLLGESKAGHFSYIGDSLLGKVNLGAGTKLANLKVFPSTIKITIDDKKYDTGLRKFGAILGDGVETGCNTVTTPGTLVSPEVLCYPNSTLRGYYPPAVIVKSHVNQQITKRQDKEDGK